MMSHRTGFSNPFHSVTVLSRLKVFMALYGGGRGRGEDGEKRARVGGIPPTHKISLGALSTNMYCFRRKWVAEVIIWTKLRKSEKRRMGKKRAKGIKKEQKKGRKVIRRKERRGGHTKRIFVRKTRATGSEGGGGRKS